MTTEQARMATASPPSARPRRHVSLEQAMLAIGSGAVVGVSPYCATPTTLLHGLAQRSYDVPGLVLSAGLLLGELPCAEEIRTGRIRFRSWHVSGMARRLASAGAVDYVPARASDVARYMRSSVDVALVRITPPDRHGNCSLGPSASYSKAMVNGARVRIAEIDPTMPRTHGADVTIPYAAFDHVVDSETPIVTHPSAPESAVSRAIASHVVGLVRNGSALQLGIGSVPEAVARHLVKSDVRGLRLIGLLNDSMVDLLESDRVEAGPEGVRAVELLGTDRLFDYADGNERVQMVSSRSVHSPVWLAEQRGLVSVCSALAVDLTGQVSSEEANGRLIAGIGGSSDFFEGAHLSPGGVRVVALPSCTSRGESRICSTFDPGVPVTLARHSVDFIVTEHGVAQLSGRSVRERAEALLAIADPLHRDALASERAGATISM